jgi:hypothetical protein
MDFFGYERKAHAEALSLAILCAASARTKRYVRPSMSVMYCLRVGGPWLRAWLLLLRSLNMILLQLASCLAAFLNTVVLKKQTTLQTVQRFSQRYIWGFLSSGTCRCITWWASLDVSKERSTIFRVWYSEKNSRPLKMKTFDSFDTARIFYPVTQCHIPEERNSQLHS